MFKKLSYIIFVAILLAACSKNEIPKKSNSQSNEMETGWLVPIDQLLISHLPADRIQSIDHPHFETLNNENLTTNETVYAYRWGNTIKIYPERILGGHEIVNDNIGDHHYAVTYCPLTGSGVAWNRKIDGLVTEFGVSGHLYNENLIPYDRNGNSFWSQMRLQSIKGVSGGDFLEYEQLVRTTGKTIIESFPVALILADTIGQTCNDSICIPLKQTYNDGDPGDNNIILPSADYFGIVNTGVTNGGMGALLFDYDNFNDSITLITTNFRNLNIIIVGSSTLQLIAAFIRSTKKPGTKFFPLQNSLPVIFGDSEGNQYDITGMVVSGPDTGNRLKSPTSYTAHSFAWESFFGEKIEVYE